MHSSLHGAYVVSHRNVFTHFSVISLHALHHVMFRNNHPGFGGGFRDYDPLGVFSLKYPENREAGAKPEEETGEENHADRSDDGFFSATESGHDSDGSATPPEDSPGGSPAHFPKGSRPVSPVHPPVDPPEGSRPVSPVHPPVDPPEGSRPVSPVHSPVDPPEGSRPDPPGVLPGVPSGFLPGVPPGDPPEDPRPDPPADTSDSDPRSSDAEDASVVKRPVRLTRNEASKLWKYVDKLISLLVAAEEEIQNFTVNNPQRQVLTKGLSYLDEKQFDNKFRFRVYGLEESIAKTGHAAVDNRISIESNSNDCFNRFRETYSKETNNDVGLSTGSLFKQYKQMYVIWFSILIGKMEALVVTLRMNAWVPIDLRDLTEDMFLKENFPRLLQIIENDKLFLGITVIREEKKQL